MKNTALQTHQDPQYNFKSKFSLSQIQIIIAGAMGFDLSKSHLGDVLSCQLADTNSTLSIVKRKSGFDFDDAKLLATIETLSPQELKAFQHVIGVVSAMPPTELIKGLLPSAHVIRRFGLAPPVDKRASGLFVVQLADGKYFHEIVLRGKWTKDIPNTTQEELAETIVFRVRDHLKGSIAHPDTLLHAMCHWLALALDWQYVRIHEDGDGIITIFKTPLALLQRDVEDGSLSGVVLPGINAPDAYIGSLPPSVESPPQLSGFSTTLEQPSASSGTKGVKK